ncbi:uncharacterized protein BO80DRAFT_442467 [Aspergillus ibericus CBS 121593]|uniref:Uncharacterized protein n=1 Tax=Aspergillus ibericus CBS 121593 TaxID=1448316 RepID=A0A395H9R0_9EURO|nr:hypothetical protein BO80DRAFT_442467 [Aspergillus ibericus CBS 121593]RAL03895.1 hypothetical protein BO80DRAFT_442467 [Aspergillus ibericus CBS 121593]
MGREDVRFEKWVVGQVGEKLDGEKGVRKEIAYCAQEVQVGKSGVVGAPMVLPFDALYDRPAGINAVGEKDVRIEDWQFLDIATL